MTEQEQIEKMAIGLEEEFVLCGTLSSCGTKRCSQCFSKYLYEQGYRKLPEDSVVLSREEYERLKNSRNIRVVTKHEEDDYEICIPASDYDEMLKQECKETVKEILNELIDSSNKITFFDCRMALGLDKLAKKYGLEIKE